MDIPIQELPFSVKVVTKELIRDQNAITLERALENSNVIPSDINSGFGAKTYAVRGFDLSNRLLVNGVRATDYASIDPALIDRVEVLKGAAANLYGRTEPGGLINIVTLKPQADFALTGSQGFGSFGLYRTTFDVTGSATADKSVLYRMIVANTNSNSYRDTVESNHLTVSPSLIFNITDRDELYLRYEHKNFRDTTDQGQPLQVLASDVNGNPTSRALVNLPRNVVAGGTNNFNDLSEDNILSKWKHEFSDQWKLNTTINYYKYNQNGHDGGLGGWITQPNLYDVYLNNPSNFTGESEHIESDLVGKFDTFGISHNTLITYEYVNRLNTYHEWSCGNYTLDLYNPIYQNLNNSNCGFPNDLSNAFGYNNRNQWQAWSAQDMIKLTDSLRILIGYRKDYAYSSSVSYGHNFGFPYNNSMAEDSKLQGRYGISYDLTPNLTWFASYSEGFGATNMGSALYNGTPAKAETSEQKEIGFKTQWLDKKLTAEVAYFDLRKQNFLLNVSAQSLGGACTTLVAYNTCNIQAGELGGQGIEFNAAGEIYENWNLNLAYTNMDPRFLKGDPSGVSNPTGQRVAGIPRDSGSAWLMYKDPFDWSTGLGATYVGERPFDAPTYQSNTTFMIPAYVRWDAVLGYTYKINKSKLTAQVSINNIFNVNAYQRAYSFGAGGIMPSEPTNAYGSIKFEF